MSPAFERRSVRRFAVSYLGDLASGSTVVPVIVSDVSYTGCGVESVGPTGDTLGTTGVISIRGAKKDSAAVLLPVLVSNQRVEAGRDRIGLRFRSLSKPQMRDLLSVLEKAVEI